MNIQQQPSRLQRENQTFSGTGGISQENGHLNFLPAFMDGLSGDIEISCYGNGKPAPFHSLDGLPEAWVLKRDMKGRVVEVKGTIISGFVYLERFFTREEAAEFVNQNFSKISFDG